MIQNYILILNVTVQNAVLVLAIKRLLIAFISWLINSLRIIMILEYIHFFYQRLPIKCSFIKILVYKLKYFPLLISFQF